MHTGLTPENCPPLTTRHATVRADPLRVPLLAIVALSVCVWRAVPMCPHWKMKTQEGCWISPFETRLSERLDDVHLHGRAKGCRGG